MLSDVHSHAMINNPQRNDQRLSAYRTIAMQGRYYRVLARQLLCHRALVRIWAVFWSFVTFTLAMLIFCNIEATGPIPILSLFVVGSVVQTIFSWMERKYINKMMVFWPVACLLFSISLLVLIVCGVALTVVPCLAFSVSVIITAAINAKNKGKIVLLLILFMQISLVAAKADGLTLMSWKQALIPLLPISLFSASAFIFLAVYTILLKCYYNQTYEVKRYTLLFLVASILGVTCLEAVILSWVYLDLSLTITAAAALCSTSTISIFLWIYIDQMALAFCLHKEIVEESEKQLKIQLILKNKGLIPMLYRYSSNWFGKEARALQQTVSHAELPQCVICTQAKSQVVWLPCGHLVLCPTCSGDLLESKMLCCVLCKQKASEICKIVPSSAVERKIEKEMGMKINREDNGYEISELYEIKIGG